MTIKIDPVYTDAALQEDDWLWLKTARPKLATAVQADIAAKCTPDQIYYKVLNHVGLHREPIARRCKHAAAYLIGRNGGGE